MYNNMQLAVYYKKKSFLTPSMSGKSWSYGNSID
ncbi:unnamed protein product [Larinioides sclopetarius]|uniref:Uncharacterized protein n=1 Tax=Larinioides sclopetarius TaxID=280406 RepID=A0AAV1ZZN8_9ARAC